MSGIMMKTNGKSLSVYNRDIEKYTQSITVGHT